MKIVQRIVWTIVLIVLVVFVLNYRYFLMHARFRFLSLSSSAASSDHVASSTALPVKYEPNTLAIPDLQILAPIKYVTQTNEQTFQEALKHGVVQYPGTAMPGEYGNMYVFGHSSDYVWVKGDYKHVFALLTEIKQGMNIIVTNASGTVFTYSVKESKIVDPKDLSVLDQHGNKKKMLTLQTSYPIGTALKRFLVIAEMDVAR